MKKVQENSTWELFFPDEAPKCVGCCGEEFEKLYMKYEQEVSCALFLVYLLYFLMENKVNNFFVEIF